VIDGLSKKAKKKTVNGAAFAGRYGAPRISER
jgi:hypothetical protein